MLILSVSFVVFQVTVTRRALGFLQVYEHKNNTQERFCRRTNSIAVGPVLTGR